MDLRRKKPEKLWNFFYWPYKTFHPSRDPLPLTWELIFCLIRYVQTPENTSPQMNSCPSCRVTRLEKTVSGMMKELATLKCVLLGNSLDTRAENEVSKGVKKLEFLPRSYSSAVKGDVSPTASQTCDNISPSYPTAAVKSNSSSFDSKFNIVVFGINESPKGTQRLTRLNKDLDCVASALSSIDNSIQADSIRDVQRLGRYNSNHEQPRPILVRFLRCSGV